MEKEHRREEARATADSQTKSKERSRALRAIRALRPGESTAVVLLDARAFCADDPDQSLRALTTRNFSGSYSVRLETYTVRGWEVLEDSSAYDGLVPTIENVRTCLAFFAMEAENAEARLRIAGPVESPDETVVYDTCPIYVSGCPQDENGHSSIRYRVRSEPLEGGRFRVWIEEALHSDPEAWNPTSLGYGVSDEDDERLFDVVASDREEALVVAGHYKRVVMAEEKESRSKGEDEAAMRSVNALSLYDQWTANAARRRTERERQVAA